MSISSSNRKAGPFACNGVTVAFPFSFKVFTTADVRVVLTDSNSVESDLALGTNYTVALNADQDTNPGGTVTTTATYATGYKVTLTSQVQNLQPVTLTNQGGFYPRVINTALDRLTILVQQVVEQVGRAVKTPISSGQDPDTLVASLFAAEVNASAAASAAASSQTSAANSATAAGSSQTAAASSATSASTSATAAGNSQTAAAASATAAANSATSAGTSATNAGNSATAAATSATNAANSATSAGTSAINAGNSATAAAGSATAAATSATNAATSATNAANSAASVGFTLTDLQSQGKTGVTSAGTAPGFTATTSPVYGALAAGQRMRVKFHAAGTTGSNTLNRDGLGAKNLMQYGYNGTKVPATVAAGMLADVEYDGTDFVILNPLPFSATLGRNKIINGNFDVWQLGVTFNVSSHLQKLADRWNLDWNGTLGTLAAYRIDLRTNSGLAALGHFPKYGIHLNQTVAGSGNTFVDLSTQIESVLTLAGKTVTISFYALSASGTKNILVKTEQYFGGGGSPTAPRFNTSSSISIGITWQRYSVTFNLSSVTQSDTLGTNGDDTLNVILSLPVNQTFGLYFTGIQIEEGSVASPFELTSYADTYEACQRYLQTSYTDGVPLGTVTSEGALCQTVVAGVSVATTIQLKTPMRTLPAIAYYNPVTGASGSWDNAGTARSVSTNTNGTKNISVSISGAAAGFSQGHYVLQDPYY